MAGETKMIIITSNADIIRQFSSKKIEDTQIINLAPSSSSSSNENVNNVIIDLAFLAESSQPVCQTRKRSLDSSDQSSSKAVKLAKKSTDMICVICGDKAIGSNYDAFTCAPCKIFFRRNAFQNLVCFILI